MDVKKLIIEQEENRESLQAAAFEEKVKEETLRELTEFHPRSVRRWPESIRKPYVPV